MRNIFPIADDIVMGEEGIRVFVGNDEDSRVIGFVKIDIVPDQAAVPVGFHLSGQIFDKCSKAPLPIVRSARTICISVSIKLFSLVVRIRFRDR